MNKEKRLLSPKIVMDKEKDVFSATLNDGFCDDSEEI